MISPILNCNGFISFLVMWVALGDQVTIVQSESLTCCGCLKLKSVCNAN